VSTTRADPSKAAAKLLEQYDEEWVARLAEELDRRLGARGLAHVMRAWRLSATALGELFGVSRQAASKWLDDGIPADRAPQVADLEAITELLQRYLKADRIPAVVRREAPGLGGESLMSLVASGRSAEALALTRQMFAFGDLHR
jgi:hypothetical protein